MTHVELTAVQGNDRWQRRHTLVFRLKFKSNIFKEDEENYFYHNIANTMKLRYVQIIWPCRDVRLVFIHYSLS